MDRLHPLGSGRFACEIRPNCLLEWSATPRLIWKNKGELVPGWYDERINNRCF